MKIAVCVKQVPDATVHKRIDAGTKRLDRSGEGALNAVDANAVEEALRASESLLRTAGRIARFGAWRVELPAFRLQWSDEVCAIHDLPPGASPSVEEAFAFYAPEDREAVRRAVDHCARLGTPFDLEARMITARG